MAITVSTARRTHEFENADRLDVRDGHLLVQRYSAGETTTIGIFGPNSWVSAAVSGSSKVTPS